MKTKSAKVAKRAVTPVRRASIPARARANTPKPAVEPAVRINSILVPIDFSELSQKALDYAAGFARQFGAKLTLVNVVEPVSATAFGALAPLVMENDKVMAACRVGLNKLVKEKKITGLVEKTLVRQGRSFDEIADAARTLKADLVIISTHGFTGLKHTCLGSTTERVVRHAPCPVLVVREHEHEFLVK